jgi:hypothetical protein
MPKFLPYEEPIPSSFPAIKAGDVLHLLIAVPLWLAMVTFELLGLLCSLLLERVNKKDWNVAFSNIFWFAITMTIVNALIVMGFHAWDAQMGGR